MRVLPLLLAFFAACTNKDGDDSAGPVDADNDGSLSTEDCDDNDATAYPGATESCDGVDNDCNGAVDDAVGDLWFNDADGDGYGDPADSQLTCEGAQGWVADNTDCDDLAATVNPGAPEVCDELDNDCDTTVDEDVQLTWYSDADNDGHGDPGSPVQSCTQPPGTSETALDCDDADRQISPNAVELCDGVDNNCDGTADEDGAVDADTWYADNDQDGYGDLNAPRLACAQPSGHVADATDCADADPNIHPDATELCNFVDDDCDGATDEDDAADTTAWYRDLDTDGFGDSATSQYTCTQPSGYVADDTDCDDRDSAIYPGAAEQCNGDDDDCDNSTDEDAIDAATWYADQDNDNFGDPNTTQLACAQPSGAVGNAADCDDSDADINPNETELCDGLDNNCDNVVDENTAADADTWYLDNDGDQYGDPASSTRACSLPSGYAGNNDDCNDSLSSINPGADEYCDSVDNNCDNVVDESTAVDAGTWYSDDDSDGYGDPLGATNACTQPSRTVVNDDDCDDTDSAISPSDAEICDGADNNCDGTIDESSATDALTWYIDNDGDGFGDSGTTTVACDQPSGYVDNDDDCDDSNSASRYCDCTLTGVGSPTLLVSSGSTYGVWTVDPLETLGAGLIWEMDSYTGSTLRRFPDQASMVARTGSTTSTLPVGWDGTGAVAYDGYLYYNQTNTRVVVKVDLSSGVQVGALTIPSAGYRNTYHYQWGGYSDIDLAVDEQGLWVIYATSANSGRLVVSKIDESNFSISATYNTGSTTKTSLGNAFMICGVLYTTSSYSSSSATVNYAYDTATGTSWTPGISFSNAYGYNSSIHYNPADGLLRAWDSGRRVTYTTTVAY